MKTNRRGFIQTIAGFLAVPFLPKSKARTKIIPQKPKENNVFVIPRIACPKCKSSRTLMILVNRPQVLEIYRCQECDYHWTYNKVNGFKSGDAIYLHQAKPLTNMTQGPNTMVGNEESLGYRKVKVVVEKLNA